MGKRGKRDVAAFVWVHCQLITTKTYKGSAKSFLIRDLLSEARLWVPDWLVEKADFLYAGEWLMLINTDLRRVGELHEVDRERRYELRALAEEMNAG